ncbi:hypothetical protein KPL74_11620 [Bacillus sp. NP157]|nr:hypothetical protein KPL74_11620 [Bacillus sp. NP157]
MKFAEYKWVAHRDSGGYHDLRHLDPFSFVHEARLQPASPGRPERSALSIRVRVGFSHHCFTLGRADPDFSMLNLYDYSADPRSFCSVRYSLLQELPSLVRALSRKRCYRTRHANYFPVLARMANGSCYTVYFSVTRSHAASSDVNLLVESAYVRATSPTIGRGAHEVSFTSILVQATA